MIHDPAVRPVLTTIPEVDRITGGRLTETAGYRVVRPRGTSDWLLIHTRHGRGRFGVAAQPDVVAGPGTLTLLGPGTPHDYGTEPGTARWQLDFSHFHPRPEWGPLLDWPQPVPGIGQLELAPDLQPRITDCWGSATYWLRSGQSRSDLFAMNALEQILLWCDTQNPRAAPLDPRIQHALEHLDRHLAEPQTVAGLARVAHLSTSRFAHLFSAQLGMSPARYLERQRIAQGRLLLEHTQRSVAEIARAVGFTEPPYFSTRFRQLVGLTPTRYRRGERPGDTPAADPAAEPPAG